MAATTIAQAISQSPAGLSQSARVDLNGNDNLPDLTPEEILEFRLQKKNRLEIERKRAEYWAKVAEPIHPEITQPDEFLAHCAAKMGGVFEVDDDNRGVLLTLSAYFAGLHEYHNLNSSKGILLYGNIGTGKTTIMRMMCEAIHAPFRVVSALDLVNEYQSQRGGEGVVEKYGSVWHNTVSARFWGNATIGLCIDDVGVESEGRNFGNTKNVVGELIATRYQNLRGPFTHITTNLGPIELMTLYGERVYDRMKEMFNVVQFPETALSRRK